MILFKNTIKREKYVFLLFLGNNPTIVGLYILYSHSRLFLSRNRIPEYSRNIVDYIVDYDYFYKYTIYLLLPLYIVIYIYIHTPLLPLYMAIYTRIYTLLLLL